MPSRDPPASDLFKALCEPVRIELARLLIARGRSDLGTLAAELPQHASVISRHLAVLHRAGLVRREKVGRHVHFELDGPALVGRLERIVLQSAARRAILLPRRDPMNEIRSLPVASPAVWTGREMAARRDWIHVLSPAEIAALDAAVAHARASGKPLERLERGDFPLGALAESAERWLDVLESGRGFLLVRGVPVARYGEQGATLAYWGLGLHLGQPVSQNAAGDLLGHVRDVGTPKRDPTLRLYKTRERLGFHTDGADVIGLLCLRPAKSGGTSRIASSATVYNEILRRRPDLVPALYEPFPFDRNGEEPAGQPPFFSIPLCRYTDGWLRMFYIGWYIRDSQRHASAPRLSPAQREVIDLIDAIAGDPALHLDMEFRAGDIQWLKNSVILHARTEYEDFPEPERKRHLLRLWLTSRRAFADSDALLNQGIPRKQGAVSDAAAGSLR